MNDRMKERGAQAKKVGSIIATILTGSKEDLTSLATDAADDVREQVDDARRRRRVLNEGCAVEGRPRSPERDRR